MLVLDNKETCLLYIHGYGDENFKPKRLSHVDLFFKDTMEEYIFNIKLAYRPFKCDNMAENETNSYRFDDRAKDFNIVNPFYLRVALDN